MNSITLGERMRSRKFWILILYGFVATVLDEIGIDLTEEELRNITYVVMLYLGGQSMVDSVKGYFKNEEPTPLLVPPPVEEAA